MHARRFTFALLLVLGVSPARADIRPFLQTHCVTCHDADTKKCGLDLASLKADALDKWVKVHDKVSAGEMPPPKKTQPPAPERIAFLTELRTTLVAQERESRKLDGRTTLRRLNRTEYENTLRDLLDLPGLNVRDLLPDDGRANGYDKSAAALDISPILMAKYAEAADVALDLAVAKFAAPPSHQSIRMYAHHQYDYGVVIPNGDGVMLKEFKYDDSRFPIPKDEYAGGKFKGLGELERDLAWKQPGTAGLFRVLGESFAGRFSKYSPVVAGKYRVSTSVWSFWWDKGEVKPSPRSGAAGIYYGNQPLAFLDAPSLKPTGHQFDVWLNPGEYLKFDPASLWYEVHVYHQKGKAAEYTGPGVAIDYLQIDGPLHEEWPPVSHKRLFGDLPLIPFSKLPPESPRPQREMPRQLARDAHNNVGPLAFATIDPVNRAGTAEQLLKEFLPRAFRRPVPADELAQYTAVAVQRLAAGACFEDAMRAAYKHALCSLDFLFLREPVGSLDNYSLASRLSYFLLNSMPDESLTRTAASGKLNDPQTLRTQVERMLADPKSERFVEDFLDQWLDLRDLDSTTPDKKLYPEYTPYLRDAMKREPREFFRVLLNENRPVAEVIDAKFATLNQRLAEHYGVPGIDGTRFRKANLPAEVHRGGLLTQAAILKVTANGTTTSPVKRGAWVMKKLLGKPPEPPPPDIPAVEPDVRGTVTIREQLAKHRDNASCAGCHAKMDPPGFALESFDVIGGLRTRYRATEGKDVPDWVKLFPSHLTPEGKFVNHAAFRSGPNVDASGETADGKKFTGIDEFKQILLSDKRLLARNVANQLVTYSTGAPVSFADRGVVEQVLDRTGGNFPLRSMVHEVIQSSLFTTK